MSTATFDNFSVIIVPVVTAQHHHALIVVDATCKEPQITVYDLESCCTKHKFEYDTLGVSRLVNDVVNETLVNLGLVIAAAEGYIFLHTVCLAKHLQKRCRRS